MNTLNKILIVMFILCFGVAAFAVEANEMNSSPNYLIILVHGIASDFKAFEGAGNLKDYLEESLKLDGYVYSYSFDKANQSNEHHAEELGDRSLSNCWLKQAKYDFHKKFPNKPIPNKYVLIAHSMGGLASRVYITSNFYHDNVKKLITLDTPHLGADGIAWYKKWEKGMGLGVRG